MEELNSTEITEEVVESGEQPEAVDQEETSHDFDLVAEPSEEEATEEKPNDGQGDAVDHQSAEDNKAARLARLKAERDAKRRDAEREAETDRKIRESGAINPYTDKPFQSMKEFLEYGQKVKEAESGEESKAQESPKEEQKVTDADRARDDLIEIMEKHPEADVDTLINNEKFRKFCGSRFGRESLNSLYEDYADLVHTAEKSAKADTRNARTTGSGSNGGERLSSSQRRSLDEWNMMNPDMKMTASEYLKRH